MDVAGAPAAVGIGLRAPHYEGLAERRPDLAFLEAHSENFFGAGGAALASLERLRALYPLSLHGVGLSLGSCDPLDAVHLDRLAALVRRFEPVLVSEHLSWSSAGGRHANDLLPLPFSEEALAHVAERIGRVQERLGRELLVENVSAYVRLGPATMPEWEFVAEVARRSGCRLLLDVNNIWVNSANHGFDPHDYLDAIDPASVAEIHLAGFERSGGLLVDTHGSTVADEVWSLYERALARIGPRPTLIEWDTDLPPLEVLLAEADRARAVAARPRVP
jgi:uncharacterized protein (UPF0276 family)